MLLIVGIEAYLFFEMTHLSGIVGGYHLEGVAFGYGMLRIGYGSASTIRTHLLNGECFVAFVFNRKFYGHRPAKQNLSAVHNGLLRFKLLCLHAQRKPGGTC